MKFLVLIYIFFLIFIMESLLNRLFSVSSLFFWNYHERLLDICQFKNISI